MKDCRIKSMEQQTECRCPTCKKTHYQVLFWTGTGMPRKFCKDCKNKRVFRDGPDGLDQDE